MRLAGVARATLQLVSVEQQGATMTNDDHLRALALTLIRERTITIA